MAASKQTAANELYANLMDEAKARFACINAALNGRLGVPAAIIREIGFLQLRMLCELVALSSMISHGDFDVAGARKLVKEYAADRIINQLEALHPKSIDNRRHLLVVLSDPARGGDVTVAYAESPKLT